MKINLSLCDRCKKVIGEKQQIIPMSIKIGDMTFEHELCKKCADSTKAEIKKLFGNVKLDYSAIIKTEEDVETPVEEVANTQKQEETKQNVIVTKGETLRTVNVENLPDVPIDTLQKGPLTLEQKRIVEACYKADFSLSQIAAKVGRKEETCKKYIEKIFGNISGDKHVESDTLNDTPIDTPIVEPMSKTVDEPVNEKTDNDTVEKNSVPEEANAVPDKHLDEGKIVALLKAGWNYKAIAYDCHCEIEDVQHVAEKYRKQR